MPRVAVLVKLPALTVAQLDRAADRLGWSRATTLAVLVHTQADRLTPDTPIPAGAMPAGARNPGQKRGKKTSKKIPSRC